MNRLLERRRQTRDPVYPYIITPKTPLLTKEPHPLLYLEKRVIILDPEAELKFRPKTVCQSCKSGLLRYHTFSSAKMYHDVEDIGRYSYTIYKCSNCRKTVPCYSTTQFPEWRPYFLEGELEPSRQSCMTRRLRRLITGLAYGSTTLSDTESFISCERVGRYMQLESRYYAHVDLYKAHIDSTFVAPCSPLMTDHCGVSNRNMGLTLPTITAILMDAVEEQRRFLLRFGGGLLGKHLKCDHTHQVLRRVKARDSTIPPAEISPIEALHGAANEGGMLLSLVSCTNTSSFQRRLQAEELIDRHSSRQIKLHSLYLDKCCEDQKFFTENMKSQLNYNVPVYLDGFHLLRRFKLGLSDKQNLQEFSDRFIRKLSIIIMNTKREIKSPEEMIKQIRELIELTKVETPDLITDKMARILEVQTKHIRSCLSVFKEDQTIYDRFGKEVKCSGTNYLECYWASIKKNTPSRMNMLLWDTTLLINLSGCNADRLLMMDKSKPFIPMAPLDLFLYQFIAHIRNDRENWSPLSLSSTDRQIFNLTPALEPAPEKPIEENATQAAVTFIANAAQDTTVLDHCSENLVNISLESVIETNGNVREDMVADILRSTDEPAQFSTLEYTTMAPEDLNSNDPGHNSGNKKKRARSYIFSHGRRGVSHSKKLMKPPATISHFMTAHETVLYYQRFLQRHSPLFNPVERRRLRALVNSTICQEGQTKLRAISFDDKKIKVIHRLWNFLVKSSHQQQVPWAEHLRLKGMEDLKLQIRTLQVLELDQYQMKTHKNVIQSFCNIQSQLQECHAATSFVPYPSSGISISSPSIQPISTSQNDSAGLPNIGGENNESHYPTPHEILPVPIPSFNDPPTLTAAPTYETLLEDIEERPGQPIDWSKCVFKKWQRRGLSDKEFRRFRAKYYNHRSYQSKKSKQDGTNESLEAEHRDPVAMDMSTDMLIQLPTVPDEQMHTLPTFEPVASVSTLVNDATSMETLSNRTESHLVDERPVESSESSVPIITDIRSGADEEERNTAPMDECNTAPMDDIHIPEGSAQDNTRAVTEPIDPSLYIAGNSRPCPTCPIVRASNSITSAKLKELLDSLQECKSHTPFSSYETQMLLHLTKCNFSKGKKKQYLNWAHIHSQWKKEAVYRVWEQRGKGLEEDVLMRSIAQLKNKTKTMGRNK